MKVAVLIIATGKYINLFNQAQKYISANFLPSHDVDLFLFTDSNDEFTDKRLKIKKYHVDKKGFPWDTLFRYHYFLKAESELKNYDYIYYMDVDTNVIDAIEEEIFSDLVATHHPGYYRKGGASFETREKSTAYISPDIDMPYYCGGFQGGSAGTYLQACKKIKENINIDGKNKITALWHDESHWNAYLYKNKPTLSLDPRYSFPEENYSWLKDLSDDKKIIVIIKNEKELRA